MFLGIKLKQKDKVVVNISQKEKSSNNQFKQERKTKGRDITICMSIKQ